MKVIIAVGILSILGLGFASQHIGMYQHAMAQAESQSMPQSMMLAAQEGHKMTMPDKPAASGGIQGCNMGGGGDMGSGRGGMMGGGMKDGVMGKDMMGCPMMAQGKKGSGMTCCCANMGTLKEKPKKPA